MTSSAYGGALAAERWASGAAESGSEGRADAGSRRLHAVVRLGPGGRLGLCPLAPQPVLRWQHRKRLLRPRVPSGPTGHDRGAFLVARMADACGCTRTSVAKISG